ncbi:hypothetical protein [Rhodococcus sp. ARC_M6]|uniref:hypothetical protein n=1 Tax=Rhodococcus sp. ARC_M6 TaxID=2928852 RepID=UPI001FB4889A|nr:hypothetical protein [Rhodococcus sp. ARC_M6]
MRSVEAPVLTRRQSSDDFCSAFRRRHHEETVLALAFSERGRVVVGHRTADVRCSPAASATGITREVISFLAPLATMKG